MSQCVCLGLGVYVDGDEHSDRLRVEACDVHPLSVGPDESAAGAAGARADHCLEAVAAIRNLLWPRGRDATTWPADHISKIALVLGFLRPLEHIAVGDAFTSLPGERPTVPVTVQQLVTIDVHFHVPTTCPRCGVSFEKADALVEESYCGTDQRCSLAHYEGRPALDGYRVADAIYELSLVTGYRCGRCGMSLVSTEPVQRGRA